MSGLTGARQGQPKREIGVLMPYLKLIEDGIKTAEVRAGYPRMPTIQIDRRERQGEPRAFAKRVPGNLPAGEGAPRCARH